MRFLIDEDVDVRVLALLKRLGHDGRRVPAGTTNGAVLRLALREHRILMTRDADFLNAAVYPASRHAGIIHLAIHPPWFEKISPALTRFLQAAPADHLDGKVVVLEPSGYHESP